MGDEDYSSLVVKEIENKLYDKGLWVKSKIKSDFDVEKTKQYYMEERIKDIEIQNKKGLAKGVAVVSKHIIKDVSDNYMEKRYSKEYIKKLVKDKAKEKSFEKEKIEDKLVNIDSFSTPMSAIFTVMFLVMFLMFFSSDSSDAIVIIALSAIIAAPVWYFVDTLIRNVVFNQKRYVSEIKSIDDQVVFINETINEIADK